MRKIVSIGIVGCWTVLSGVCPAQIATITPPPPPPSESGSSQTGNNSSGTPVNPSFGPVNQTPNGTTPASPQIPNSPTPDANAVAPIPIITAQTLTDMAALDDKTTLHPGDRISFRVIEDRDDAIPRTVTDTGEVDFPYVGRIKVQGLTCRQVAIQLKQLLEVDYYKRATVIVGLDVIADHPIIQDLAWIIGQVRGVGPQVLSKSQPVTVSQLILRAGGFADFADQRKVRVIHHVGPALIVTNAVPAVDVDNEQKGVIVDVKSVYEGKSTYDPIVEPNDYIIVPKKVINF